MVVMRASLQTVWSGWYDGHSLGSMTHIVSLLLQMHYGRGSVVEQRVSVDVLAKRNMLWRGVAEDSTGAMVVELWDSTNERGR